jgi:hypothetical protein
MNPVTVELLNSVEKYHRSKQVEASQLLNQAQAGRSSRPSLHKRVMHGLGTLRTRRRPTAERAPDQAAA